MIDVEDFEKGSFGGSYKKLKRLKQRQVFKRGKKEDKKVKRPGQKFLTESRSWDFERKDEMSRERFFSSSFFGEGITSDYQRFRVFLSSNFDLDYYLSTSTTKLRCSIDCFEVFTLFSDRIWFLFDLRHLADSFVRPF
ncbi:hypothetical protein FRX31_031866 [Thalictrum thalictroides]|uniref:Uncharacterized protein n=1 Tax=Thalictrum thalictroides TaxID=46969 RepID=A0A7J6V0R2_THATH|nr:hypothetical protein FRX31_031866 [Thalictrum thalictroides]